MEGHVKALGWIYIVTSALSALVITAVLVAVGIGLLVSGEKEAFIAMPFVMIFALVALLFTAVPGFIGGIGLLGHRRWARVVILVVAALGLFSIPIGTALGIYAFYVLLHRDTEVLFSPYRYSLPGDPA